MIETFLSIFFTCKKVKYVQYTTRITATLRLLWGIFCGKNPVFKYWHYLYCRKGRLMSLSEDAPGLTVHCITEKPKDMDPSMTSECKSFNVLWHTQTTHVYYCRRKLNSLVLLFIYIIDFQSFFKWDSSKTSSGDNSEKPLFLSSNEIFRPRSIRLDVFCSPNTDGHFSEILNIFASYRAGRWGLRWFFFFRGGQFSRVQWLGGHAGQRRVP